MNEICKEIRKDIIKMVYQANSGHIGGSLSAVELLYTLYFEKMNISVDNYQNKIRDRFILSKGHASPLLYATLKAKGIIDFDLTSFRQINSQLQGHPNMNLTPGVEMSTGSLGQGISAAVGMATSFKLDNLPNKVYTLLGDGEIEEGQVWEALMSAAQYELDNLTIIIDNNNLQIDGEITSIMSPYPITDKLKAFNFDVFVVDGHDIKAIKEALDQNTNKPKAIVAKTIKGKGISFMENDPNWHGTAPTKEEFDRALAELEGK